MVNVTFGPLFPLSSAESYKDVKTRMKFEYPPQWKSTAHMTLNSTFINYFWLLFWEKKTDEYLMQPQLI